MAHHAPPSHSNDDKEVYHATAKIMWGNFIRMAAYIAVGTVAILLILAFFLIDSPHRENAPEGTIVKESH
ncbi:MAG: hypothetical protein AB7G80_02065 [Dongiaceae bacterium]